MPCTVGPQSRPKRWLVVRDGRDGPHVIRQIDDECLAKMYAMQLAYTVRGIRVMPNPARIVEDLLGWDQVGAVLWYAQLWEAIGERVSGERYAS